MKRCFRALAVLVFLLQAPWVHAAYECKSDAPTSTQSGDITTGFRIYLTFSVYCTRLTSDQRTTAFNKPGAQFGIFNTDVNATAASLINTVNTTTWVLPMTVAQVVADGSNSNNLSSTGAVNPACATAGAPTTVSAWIYSQAANTNNPPGSSLQFSSSTSLTTTRPRFLTICLYVPPPAAPVPQGTYSRSMKLRSVITSNVANLAWSSGEFIVSVNVSYPCTIGTQANNPPLTIPYTSFTTGTQTAALQVRANCPGFWAAAVSPTTGTLQGIAYELGLGTSSDVPTTGALSSSLTNQSGVKDIFIHGRAASRQAGNAAPCGTSCSAQHGLTITY